jgi:hypothetical protein
LMSVFLEQLALRGVAESDWNSVDGAIDFYNKYLERQGIAYKFDDFKNFIIDGAEIQRWYASRSEARGEDELEIPPALYLAEEILLEYFTTGTYHRKKSIQFLDAVLQGGSVLSQLIIMTPETQRGYRAYRQAILDGKKSPNIEVILKTTFNMAFHAIQSYNKFYLMKETEKIVADDDIEKIKLAEELINKRPLDEKSKQAVLLLYIYRVASTFIHLPRGKHL